MLVRKHQNAHGGGIIWGILLMVMSCFNLYDDVGNNRFYFGILMMVLGIVQLIYSIRKFRKGDIFRKEWIAHWRKVKKDVRNLSFDELNDMARWL